MKLGDVLRKERERRKVDVAEMARCTGLPEEEYGRLEAGGSAAEKWGPLLALIAIQLGVPTSRLIAESGQAADARPGQCGRLIRIHREQRGRSLPELATQVGLTAEELETIERGGSELEKHAPCLLAFAERVELPVFNLFYPCGLPLAELEDYP